MLPDRYGGRPAGVRPSLTQPPDHPGPATPFEDGQPVEPYIFSPGSILWEYRGTVLVLPQAATEPSGYHFLARMYRNHSGLTSRGNAMLRISALGLIPRSVMPVPSPHWPYWMLSHLWQGWRTAASQHDEPGPALLHPDDQRWVLCTGTDQIDVQTRSCAMPVPPSPSAASPFARVRPFSSRIRVSLQTNYTWVFPGWSACTIHGYQPGDHLYRSGVYSVMLLAEKMRQARTAGWRSTISRCIRRPPVRLSPR